MLLELSPLLLLIFFLYFVHLEEYTSNQVKELNKTIQDLKIEVETIKKNTKGDNSGNRKPRKEVRSH